MFSLPIVPLSNATKTMSPAFVVFEKSDHLSIEHDFLPPQKTTFWVLARNFSLNAGIEPHIKIN